MILKLGMHHQGLMVYTVSINDDPVLTLNYFTAMPNLVKITDTRPRCQVSVYRTIGPLDCSFDLNSSAIISCFHCFKFRRMNQREKMR